MHGSAGIAVRDSTVEEPNCQRCAASTSSLDLVSDHCLQVKQRVQKVKKRRSVAAAQVRALNLHHRMTRATAQSHSNDACLLSHQICAATEHSRSNTAASRAWSCCPQAANQAARSVDSDQHGGGREEGPAPPEHIRRKVARQSQFMQSEDTDSSLCGYPISSHHEYLRAVLQSCI